MVVADGVVVTSVRGELDLETAGELRRRLGSEGDEARRRVVDLSGCTFIDSTGVGLLVRAFRAAERDGNPSSRSSPSQGARSARRFGSRT